MNEEKRQEYLAELSQIIIEEKLTPEQATQLMFGEIAGWLMVIANTLADKEQGKGFENLLVEKGYLAEDPGPEESDEH